ncbi:hypothetical protein AB0D34_27400 [Streptomyces sp. NPDC048420]
MRRQSRPVASVAVVQRSAGSERLLFTAAMSARSVAQGEFAVRTSSVR